ncbi:uncharacterized protein C8R40DRAFT_45965 [Lentinula edodes]|uniref:uncharacterized protein n=1 Tax=Lentinula edodes TaxID=5353 RepID=UPI001E8CA0B2|nr:uncharacterized protein C8R40DRAFT_45965 [Lentinula edodes]KAH7881473.1 hypothetical protein C8R40DRAFT_45965 [Lentinula edodes]
MSNLTPSSLLAGSWVNMILLAISLCIDTVCTGVVCYNVYLYLILEPGEQVFFTYRYWRITHNKFITLLISTITASHVAFAWVLGIGLIRDPVVSQSGLNLTIIAATLCAATDLLIAVIMFHTMRTIKTTYTATQSLLRRISIQSVACGSTTSVFTIIMVSLLVTHNLEPFTVIFDILGRLYTLTILINYISLRKPMAHASAAAGGSEQRQSRSRSHSIVFGAARRLSHFHCILRSKLTFMFRDCPILYCSSGIIDHR